MRKVCSLFFSLCVLGLVGAGNVCAITITINDSSAPGNTSYWGGKLNPEFAPNQDVLVTGQGKIEDYDFTEMKITFTGTKMAVEIFGDFTKTWNQNGDLYLNSKGWKVSGTGPHYETDTFTKAEGWDYVVTALGPLGAGVYTLSYPSIIMTAAGGRSEQAFQEGYGDIVVSATTNYGSATTSLFFEFDYTLLGSLGPNSFGVHFTQSCGNDVIEGGTPVPEPSSILLLMCGLAGLGLTKMRKKTS